MASTPSRRPLPSKPGSPEDDAKLLELLQRGSKPKLIAARLTRTFGGCSISQGHLESHPAAQTRNRDPRLTLSSVISVEQVPCR